MNDLHPHMFDLTEKAVWKHQPSREKVIEQWETRVLIEAWSRLFCCYKMCFSSAFLKNLCVFSRDGGEIFNDFVKLL
ncbi:hypothetical protein QWV57_06895 [Geobacillus zalihae]|uniref:hypothetical protein n=1 Tax=Geobacillus zalihae TaxID=213419 RepID=UPI002610AB6C|nr:hypothetical protein [Geobacillus zalihae]WKA48674.1 hypothetical protein QWV57_06895 [Geobacillus zalihae]